MRKTSLTCGVVQARQRSDGPGPKTAGWPTSERSRDDKESSCRAESRHWTARSCKPPACRSGEHLEGGRALHDEHGGVHLVLQRPGTGARLVGKQSRTQLTASSCHHEGDGVLQSATSAAGRSS